MPTRSTKLASMAPAAGAVTVALTVPAGFTYLVKSVGGVNYGGPADVVSVWAEDPAGARFYFIGTKSLATNVPAEWEGWVALNPGDVLKVYSPNGTSWFWLSGTKLPGVA